MANAHPEGYMPRLADREIEECLAVYGALEITGTKWCGKTWAARRHAESIVYLDEGSNLEKALAAPEAMLAGTQPRVIDEWQLAPRIWDTVRHAVDEAGRKRGMWILTGSSTPDKSEVHHSGAGRIGRVRMLPMSLFESGDSSGEVSLSGLFDGEFAPATAAMDLDKLVELCIRGGWPAGVDLPPRRALRVARDYLAATLTVSMPARGASADTATRLAQSLARNLGQPVTAKTLVADMYGPEEKESAVAERTAQKYVGLFRSLFSLEPVGGWAPPIRSPKRYQTKEINYFADPSLAVAALQMNAQGLVSDWQTLGLVFENLAIRDLIVYGRALPESVEHPVRYYRDDAGLEVDAIIEQADGRWGAIEIKLSEDKVDAGARNLVRMAAKLTKNPAARVRSPEFLAVLVGLGDTAYRRQDGVYVIPIAALGP